MSTVRTIRRLDERTEEKRVDGILIETGVPIPNLRQKGALLKVLRALNVGESFQHHVRVRLNEYAKHLPGRKFTTRKTGGLYRVWRIE